MGCFALARRSCFFRRLARFWALSLPLLCPISPTFARFLTESKASDWDEPTLPVKDHPRFVSRETEAGVWAVGAFDDAMPAPVHPELL